MNASQNDARIEAWARGDSYELYMARWSRLVARDFVRWLARPPGLRWLDVGCGTGALVQAILDEAAPAAVVGIDRSAEFVEYARAQIQDARATFRIADAQDLVTERGAYETVVSGLVLNFVAGPERMVAEMMRACRLNGRVALYVWDYAGKMEFLRYFWDTAADLDPAARELDQGARFPVANARRLWELFLDTGLNDVQSRVFEVPTHFRNFEAYWTPFLGGEGSAPSYVAVLSEGKRAALREALRARLPTARDGSIKLTARALAVRGTR
jgi:SAM-dependent methyltransferase